MNDKFLQACIDAIEHFEHNEEKIRLAYQQGAQAVKELYAVEVRIDQLVKNLRVCKEHLANLCTHIQCELAIVENNPSKLKESAKRFTKNYRSFGIFSLQSKKDYVYPWINAGLDYLITHRDAKNIELVKTGTALYLPEAPDATQQTLMQALEEGLAESDYGQTMQRILLTEQPTTTMAKAVRSC